MTADLKDLADNRKALLLAEVAAWLHDMGKCSDEMITFTSWDKPDDFEYKYKTEYSYLVGDHTIDILGGLPLKELIEQARPGVIKDQNKPLLIRYLGRCHAAAHIEKEGQADTKQKVNDTRLSSPFGYETEPLKGLTDKLKSLPFDRITNRKYFLDSIKKTFKTALGDTERPINEVDLWDWSSIVAALYKAALASALLRNESEPNDLKWRLLAIRFDSELIWGTASKIPVLLARKDWLTKGLGNVKTLLEEDYPLGNEVYRDENGSIFVVPDIPDLLNIRDSKENKTLEELISEKLGYEDEVVVSPALDIDAWWGQNPGGRPDLKRDKVPPIGQILSEKPYSPPDITAVNQWWKAASDNTEICTVSWLRPQGAKGKARKSSDYWAEKVIGRAKEWKNNLNTTIWIDEAADEHGRICLLTGKLDISDWLGPEYLFSWDEIPGNDDEKFVEILEQKFGIDWVKSAKIEKIDDDKTIKVSTTGNNYLLLELNDEKTEVNLKIDRGEIGTFIAKMENDKIAIYSGGPIKTLLVRPPDVKPENALSKTPSFARIRRIWETTKTFWEDVEQDFHKTIGSVSPRLKITGEFTPVNGNNILLSNAAYEAELDGVKITVFCGDKKEFIIIENLQRLARKIGASSQQSETYYTSAIFLKDRIIDSKNLKIYDSEGKKRKEPIGHLTESQIEPESTPYIPAIPILSEPGIFMAIVPADRSLEIAKSIKGKYEKEMGKVRNRLPISLGLVFAKSHTPLAALMDAGRRMLNIPTEAENWVLDEDAQDGGSDCILKFANGIIWKVPVKMGDGTDDIWYPNFYVDENRPARPSAFRGPDGWLVHAAQLKKGDNVKISPSRFDFEFLDSASRRFDVSYNDKGKRRDIIKSERPYLLEELENFETLWNILSDKLARSQIKNIIGLIETKREEWPPDKRINVFENFVHDVLHNANWKDGKPSISEMEMLEKAAVSGQLRDIVELYMDIIKIKSEEDK